MKPKVKNLIHKNDLLCLGILCILFLLVLSPERYIASVKNGLQLFSSSVLPSLFPFLVFTKLFTACKLRSPKKKNNAFMQRLFGLPTSAGYIFLLSALSGYPVGAKLIADFYNKGEITYEEAKSMSAFCSTSGPFFVIGTVGGMMFNSAKIGYLLLICHLIASFICGIIFSGHTRRHYRPRTQYCKALPQISSSALNESVYDAILSILTVGGFITVFYMLADMLLFSGVLKPLLTVLHTALPHQLADGIIYGFIEVTRGCRILSSYPTPISVCVTCAIISFGGISISCQAIAYLKQCKIKARTYLLFKAVHAALAFILCLCYYALKSAII